MFNKKTIELCKKIARENPEKYASISDDFILVNKILKDIDPNYKEISKPSSFQEMKTFRNQLGEYAFNTITVLDFETTSTYGYGVSIALLIHDLNTKKTIERYTLINPLTEIEEEAIAVHKITPEMIENEKPFSEIHENITKIAKISDLIVGHNIDFDLRIMEREYDRIEVKNPFKDIPKFCTMKPNKEIVGLKDINGKKLKDPKLIETANFYGINTDVEFHNALEDTKITLQIFLKMLGE